MSTEVIGKPVDRADGRAKVTGAARYAAEFPFSNVAHAVLVLSTIAKGKIREIDTRAAEAAPGVLAVITHKNAPKLYPSPDDFIGGSKPGEKLLPMQSDIIYYDGQTIGIVVADTLERAKHAASLLNISYDEEKPTFQIEQGLAQAYQPKVFFGEELQVKRGDAANALASAENTKIEETYSTPVEHHNPMEPPASIAKWDEDNLTVYTATQWVMGSRKAIAEIIGVPKEKVRVISNYVGGGFGCKGFVWPHGALAAVAARQVKRPVKLVQTRQQMFTSNGHRGRTIQKLAMSAARDGKLTAIRHETTTQTSMVDEFVEPCGLTTRILYACPNLEVVHNVVRLNTGTPTPMRAPGESPGTFALESALDELAYKLKIDPVELRVINHADVNPQTGKPWSSKHLKECYRRGAESFGWSRRKPEPRSMRDGRYLIGMGMATATYPGYRVPASAKVQILADGRAIVSSATQDIGTGTYTIMAQIAADALGIPVERIEPRLGDSTLPPAPVSGGSQTAASVGPAVREAALSARNVVIRLAVADKRSPLSGHTDEQIAAADGRLFLKSDSSKGESYGDILRRHSLPSIECQVTTGTATMEVQTEPRNPAVALSASNAGESANGGGGCVATKTDRDINADTEKYAFQSFGAQFAEVRVDPDFGTVRVSRFTSALDIGRVLNAKTARSQAYSGVIYGLGMALLEETVFDPNRGRIVTRNLADYHVPVNADVPDIDAIFIDEPDTHFNPLGSRGVGEIGITGVAAAIANAVYHATGVRVRDLPIVPEKLI